jgi:hypothetical protein
MSDFNEGDRVQFASHTDLWMRGSRYGTVTIVGPLRVTVLPDIGASVCVPHDDITLVRKADER